MATHEVPDFFFDFGQFNHFVRIVVVNAAGPNGNKAKFVQTYSAVFICSQNLDASVGIIRVDEAQSATAYPKRFCFFQPNHLFCEASFSGPDTEFEGKQAVFSGSFDPC
tara:strand:- start:3 stop:329 length:327 start_codon:yes stop_codon:yes gene_type:complete